MSTTSFHNTCPSHAIFRLEIVCAAVFFPIFFLNFVIVRFIRDMLSASQRLLTLHSANASSESLTEGCLCNVQGQNGFDGMVGAKGAKGEVGPKVGLALFYSASHS